MAHVLVMEDDPDQAHMLGALLSNAGHSVELTYSGGEAWVMLMDRPFDVLLTDMRVLSAPRAGQSDGGLALIIRIRNATGATMPEWLSPMRIIAISGVPMRSDEILDRARTFGANLCLRKPAKSADILSAINNVMDAAPGTFFPQPALES